MPANRLLIATLLLLPALAGCTDFAQHRLREWTGAAEPARDPRLAGPPLAAPPLAIAAAQPVGRTVDPPPAKPASPLRLLADRAAERHRTMDSYIFRLKRREVVAGEKHPEEVMLVKLRREPWSVYFKWLGTEAKGREVVYVKGKHGDQIHTLTAAGDIPFIGAGTHFKVSPDNALVKSKSRYPITEAGLASCVARFGLLVDAVEKGDMKLGSATYLAKQKRPEFEAEVEAVLQTVPPQSDPLLPKGGRRWWFFDAQNGLPVLVVAHDETDREVEYYCHDHIQCPVRLDDDDFNPDRLWAKK